MKKLRSIYCSLLAFAAFASCQKQEVATQTVPGSTVTELAVSWVNVIPTSSFNNFSTYWNNLYPWGSDHNGSARMRAQNIATSGGVLTLTSAPSGSVGNSNKDATHTGANFVDKVFNIIIDYQMEGSSGAPGPTGTTYMRAKNVLVEKSATL